MNVTHKLKCTLMCCNRLTVKERKQNLSEQLRELLGLEPISLVTKKTDCEDLIDSIK